MPNICKPYRNCKVTDISQKFGAVQSFDGQKHTGVDFAPYGGYGIPLVAPEIVYIDKVIDSLQLSSILDPLERGYGVLMRSMSVTNLYYLYWHCLPIFPISQGETCKQGQVVAYMGNSGNVFRAGTYVPLEERTKTKNGTHLHLEAFYIENGQKRYVDPMGMINWNIPVDYSITGMITAIQFVVSKIKQILK